jgi:hypothetical protein
MAEQYNPLSKSPKSYSYNPPATVDVSKKGMIMMQENLKSNNIIKRNRYNPAFTLNYDDQGDGINEKNENNNKHRNDYDSGEFQEQQPPGENLWHWHASATPCVFTATRCQ